MLKQYRSREYFYCLLRLLCFDVGCFVEIYCDNDNQVGEHVDYQVEDDEGLPVGPDQVGVHPHAAGHDVDNVEEVADAVTVLCNPDRVDLDNFGTHSYDAVDALNRKYLQD